MDVCGLGCVERNLTCAWAHNGDLTMVSKVGKILVVDDNLGIRRALEILLPMHFAEVIATIRTRRKDIKAGLETCSGVK